MGVHKSLPEFAMWWPAAPSLLSVSWVQKVQGHSKGMHTQGLSAGELFSYALLALAVYIFFWYATFLAVFYPVFLKSAQAAPGTRTEHSIVFPRIERRARAAEIGFIAAAFFVLLLSTVFVQQTVFFASLAAVTLAAALFTTGMLEQLFGPCTAGPGCITVHYGAFLNVFYRRRYASATVLPADETGGVFRLTLTTSGSQFSTMLLDKETLEQVLDVWNLPAGD